MTGLTILIPAALFLGLLGLAAFYWSMRNGQYDDLDGAAERILLDEHDDPAQDRGDIAHRGQGS
ncbi:cbb3-type cytochrome oxidase assembly protein CcoS [Sphingobium olei]|jgi:cbb3-type cytochrome oxidase maturation protein|uniref:Cbb3-type cytochrome oxidase assembly protein CcoS n=1 Tax=Sphingobium olei TaxID=420955 RepID=A0ABW3NZW9_9SPHN